MVRARGRFEWNQTSLLVAAVINIMRDPKKGKPATPDMFNPFALKEKKKPTATVPITVLKDVFVR